MKKLENLDPTALAGNPRATLVAWKKYESTVLAAHRMHPQPYVFHPTNMAPATVASRIRDAIRGKLAFDYPSSLSTQDLLRWWSEVIVKTDGQGNVVIGPMQATAKPLEFAAPASDSGFVFDRLSFRQLSAFAVLLSSNCLSGPVVIRNPPDLTLIQSLDLPNFEILNREDGSIVLL